MLLLIRRIRQLEAAQQQLEAETPRRSGILARDLKPLLAMYTQPESQQTPTEGGSGASVDSLDVPEAAENANEAYLTSTMMMHMTATAEAEKNSEEQKHKTIAIELQELQKLVTKEQALRSQASTKAEEAVYLLLSILAHHLSAKIEDLAAANRVHEGEQQERSAELEVSNKLIRDLEHKIREQDEQWCRDVDLLKANLTRAKSLGVNMKGEIVILKETNTQLQADVQASQNAAAAERKAAEAAVAAMAVIMAAASDAAEASQKENEVANAKAKESERGKADMQKTKELAEERLEQTHVELENCRLEINEMEKQWESDVVQLEGKAVEIDQQREKVQKLYVRIQKLASVLVSKMKSVLTSESVRLQDMCLQSEKDVESLRLEVVRLQFQVEKQEIIIWDYERNLAQQNKNVKDKTKDWAETAIQLGRVEQSNGWQVMPVYQSSAFISSWRPNLKPVDERVRADE